MTYTDSRVVRYPISREDLVEIDSPLDCGTFDIDWTFSKDGGPDTPLASSSAFRLALGTGNDYIFAES